MKTINQHSPGGVAERGRKRMEFLYQLRKEKLVYLPCLWKNTAQVSQRGNQESEKRVCRKN